MRNRKIILGAIFVILAAVIVFVEVQSRSVGPLPAIEEMTNQGDAQVTDRNVVYVINRDGIPALTNPTMTDRQDADVYLDDEQYGISITVEGETRFYPYQILVWHEVVNDIIKNVPIAVTYCPLSSAGIVYSRNSDGETLEFGVSGKLWNSNLLMYDKSSESLWSQFLGEAIDGAHSGAQLAQISSRVMTWKEWKSMYPNGKVLSRETGYARDYTRNPYLGYDEQRTVLFPVDNRDDRLHPKELVYGYVDAGGNAKAYPAEYVFEEKKIVDSVNGNGIVIEHSVRDGVRAIATNSDGSKEELNLKTSFWFTWAAFFKDSGLYDPIGESKKE
jgi:hypothetical protein